MSHKRPLNERLSIRMAKTRQKLESRTFLRLLGGRGAATLLVGAALSIGGLSDAMSHVHFLVEKNLDTVRVVRQNGHNEKVVARLTGDFAGNSVFKLSQLLPARLVTRQLALFDDKWIADVAMPAKPDQQIRNVFIEEIARINNAIHGEFFTAAMPYGDIIHEKAKKYAVDPLLVAAVIEQESRFQHTARSQVGARGLMQLMPSTGRWMGARDLYDPAQNVDAGVKYIKYLQSRFNGDIKNTIAAYNAGEGNVRSYNGVPPFRETQHYVRTVLRNYDKRNKQLKQWQDEQKATSGGTSEADASLTVR